MVIHTHNTVTHGNVAAVPTSHTSQEFFDDLMDYIKQAAAASSVLCNSSPACQFVPETCITGTFTADGFQAPGAASLTMCLGVPV